MSVRRNSREPLFQSANDRAIAPTATTSSRWGRSMLAVLLVACAAEVVPDWYEPATPAEPIELTYSTAGVEGWAVEDGCAAWQPEGVTCAAADGAPADLRVVARDGCPVDEAGDPVLGDHETDAAPGEITVFTGCEQTEDLLVPLLAHEIGHALGIYFHVAPDCDDRDTEALGPPLCGLAIMNPTIDLARETVADHQAFMARNVEDAVDEEP